VRGLIGIFLKDLRSYPSGSLRRRLVSLNTNFPPPQPIRRIFYAQYCSKFFFQCGGNYYGAETFSVLGVFGCELQILVDFLSLD